MLAVSNVTKQFRGEGTPILKDVSFTVNAGECVGLIGPNGCGKSTLLNIIIGRIPADRGSVLFNPPDLRAGYLAQGLDAPDETPLRDVLLPGATQLAAAEREVERLAEAIGTTNQDAMDGLMTAYSAALERLERLGKAVDAAEGERMLAKLGLGDVPLDVPVAALSGGQKTRLGLAALLLSQPQLLILDEPTNHLDVTALEWLEAWLRSFRGGVLLVSHDRTFLDEIVTRIVTIDEQTHTARVFDGNYSDYVAVVRSEWDKQWAQWRDQQVEIARLKAAVQRTMAKAVSKENATKDSTQRRYAKKVAKVAKARERRLERYMESDERVDKPIPSWPLRMDNLALVEAMPSGRDVLTLDKLAIGYEPDAPLLAGLELTVRTGERVAVLGPNGHGKSTLLKTIVGELPPLAGRVRLGANVQVGYLAQEQEILDPRSNPLETLLAEAPFSHTEARTFLHFFLFAGDDVFRPVAQLSFGERARLMLAVLVGRGANLLVLDEPINHLDVPSRERFEQALSHYQGTVLAVVHDRYFVDRFATKVWHIEDATLVERVHRLEPA